MWCLIISIPDLCPLSYFNVVVGLPGHISILALERSNNGWHSGTFFKPEKNLEFFRLKNTPEMPTLVSLSD